jgi:nucleoside-diphosphate-sugar epimerase
MTDTAVLTPPVEKPLSAFVSYADTGIGRAVVRALLKHGYKVAGSTANGTVGAAAIRALGAVPTYTDLSREADIRSTLHMTKADVVVDLSGSLANALPFTKVGVDTTKLDVVPLLNACHAVGIHKLIYVGFLGALGNTGGDHHDEGHGHGHHDTASESTALSRDNEVFKALARAESVLTKSDFNVVVLRAGYLYGDHSPSLDALVAALKGGRPVVKGAGVAPFVHVDDLADAIVIAAQQRKIPSRVYHITGDTPLSFDAFATRLGEALGVGDPFYMPVLSTMTSGLQETLLAQNIHVSNGLAKTELGWSPKYASVVDGVERMLMIWRAEEAPALPAPKSTETALVQA